MSTIPKSGWIRPENGDDLRAFDGWFAELWFYHVVPHRTLTLRFSSRDQEGEFYLILDRSKFSGVPSSWRIGGLVCRRLSDQVLEFEDRAAGVSLQAYAARVLHPDGYESYLGVSNRDATRDDEAAPGDAL